jgi:hypothetical protein
MDEKLLGNSHDESSMEVTFSTGEVMGATRSASAGPFEASWIEADASCRGSPVGSARDSLLTHVWERSAVCSSALRLICG